MNSIRHFMLVFFSLKLTTLVLISLITSPSCIYKVIFTLAKRISIQKFFNVKRNDILFELVTDPEYINPQASKHWFIVYIDAQQHKKSHFMQVIQ